MCSIFGIILGQATVMPPGKVRLLTETLFRLSESRGKDASGLAWRDSRRIRVRKKAVQASSFIRTNEFKTLFPSGSQERADQPLAIIGHCRMATNGLETLWQDNQPVVKDGVIAAHNGIIVNDRDLWTRHPDCRRDFVVDTEIFVSLLKKYLDQSCALEEAFRRIYEEIDGMTSIVVMMNHDARLVLATNNGSLYALVDEGKGLALFASERAFLEKCVSLPFLKNQIAASGIEQIEPGYGLVIDPRALTATPFSLTLRLHASPTLQGGKSMKRSESTLSEAPPLMAGLVEGLTSDDGAVKTSAAEISPALEIEEPGPVRSAPNPAAIRPAFVPPDTILPSALKIARCTKCVLPATIPFIEFDDQGVCHYCRRHIPKIYKGEEALKKDIASRRKESGRHDCIVAFSGGRDSSFGLHYIKKVLKMNPLVYSYDWGMITDLGRRNQSRMCGRLGVEHILIDAGIKRKLRNIRLNIAAWLKNPQLGLVPLLMAGDKPFYYYSACLKKLHSLGLSLICSGNPYERAAFKSGFSGVRGSSWGKGNLTGMPFPDKIHLAFYYGREFLRNPAYLNDSVGDTLWGYYASYFVKDENLYLYDYLPWNEEQINRTLKEEYGWESAGDTTTTWRIGDGTAPFYNYIYYTMAGFTEFDSFRSGQIRDGVITRDQALAMIESENQPRWPSLIWYAERVGFDLWDAVKIINRAPKLYER